MRWWWDEMRWDEMRWDEMRWDDKKSVFRSQQHNLAFWEFGFEMMKKRKPELENTTKWNRILNWSPNCRQVSGRVWDSEYKPPFVKTSVSKSLGMLNRQNPDFPVCPRQHLQKEHKRLRPESQVNEVGHALVLFGTASLVHHPINPGISKSSGQFVSPL